MSTTPQAQPTVANPNELTPEQIAEQLANQVAPAAQTPEPTPLERDFSVVLATGQTYKGPTKDAVIQQLVKAQEEASKRIKELSDAQKAAVQAPAPPTPQAPTEPQFDANKYYQMLAENPIAAQSYALQFTPEAQELRRQTQEQAQFLESLKAQAVINEFKAEVPDLPVDDDSAKKFEETFNKFNLPLTKDNLKLVHGYCVANKIYSPLPQTPAPAIQQATPLPTLNTSGGNVQTQTINPYTMSQDELKAYIDQFKANNGQ